MRAQVFPADGYRHHRPHAAYHGMLVAVPLSLLLWTLIISGIL